MSEYTCYGGYGRWSYEGCNDCRGVRWVKGKPPKKDLPTYACTCNPRWVLFTKRTDDPKLAWLERQLAAAGITYRRHGESFHAPILEVPEEQHEQAWAILQAKVSKQSKRTIDDLPDDHPMFR